MSRDCVSAPHERSSLYSRPSTKTANFLQIRNWRQSFGGNSPTWGARIALFQAKWPAALLSDDDDQFIADRKRLREEDAPVTEWALRMLK